MKSATPIYETAMFHEPKEDPVLDLGPIEKRLALSTEGPWHRSGQALFVQISQQEFDPLLNWRKEGDSVVPFFDQDDDAEFVAHAWQDMKGLVAEIKRLRAENDKLTHELNLRCPEWVLPD